jgi:hypothetical protein
MLSFTHAQQQQFVAMDSYIESVRADLRADKVALIAQAMNFSPEEAKTFWPVYRKYEAQMIALNDDRVAMMRTLAEVGVSITDSDARQLTNRMIEFDVKRSSLHKKYVAELQKTCLSPVTVARLVQLEHRFDLFVDMNLASSVPPPAIQAANTR